MRTYFFDTCALQQRYVQTHESRRVRRIIGDRRNSCHISEWTVVEISSALGRRCRNGGLDIAEFDAMIAAFFADVEAGRLKVRDTSQREMQRARDLLRFAGMVKRRRLSTGDALIATSCLDLAYESRAKIVFYTADQGLFGLLQLIDAFTANVELRFLAVEAPGP